MPTSEPTQNTTSVLGGFSPDCEEQCGRPATVYAVDPYIAGGYGGRYCEPCVKGLYYEVVDRL
jgi:hypothetical protein